MIEVPGSCVTATISARRTSVRSPRDDGERKAESSSMLQLYPKAESCA